MPPEPALTDLQAAFRQNALADIDAGGTEPPAPAALTASIVADGLSPERRLAIHRNHYAQTLVEALAGVFEAVRALVGSEYFDAFALRFARAEPAAGPCLFEYGAAFPAAIAAAPGMEAHGYVADVARLEWAMHESFHAPAAAPLSPSRLTAIPSENMAGARLRLHPTVRLHQAEIPTGQLWRAARDGAVSPEVLQGDPARILLSRPALDVSMEILSEGRYALLAAIKDGEPLGQAVAAATSADPTFDFGEELGACLADGVFADEVTTVS